MFFLLYFYKKIILKIHRYTVKKCLKKNRETFKQPKIVIKNIVITIKYRLENTILSIPKNEMQIPSDIN